MENKNFEELTTETLSHFMKTPFSIIMGFCELLTSGIAGELNPQQTYYIEKMKEEIIKADDFLNNYLDRIETHLYTELEENHEIDLTDILKDIFLVEYSGCENDRILPDFEIPTHDLLIISKGEIFKGFHILLSEFKSIMCGDQILKLILRQEASTIRIVIFAKDHRYTKSPGTLNNTIVFKTIKKLFLTSNFDLDISEKGISLVYEKR